MTETRRLKNVVIFIKTVLSFVLSRRNKKTTDMYSEKRTLTSISAQIHVMLKIIPKIYLLEWLTD